jgi:hypothetical protein
MSVAASALRFAIGNVIGVAILIPLLGPLGIAPLRDAVWLALLWLPISLVYCVVIVAALRVFHVRNVPSLLLLFGFIVAFFPLVSGVWPTYWATLRFGAIIVAVHITLLAVVGFLWWLSVRLFTKWI